MMTSKQVLAFDSGDVLSHNDFSSPLGIPNFLRIKMSKDQYEVLETLGSGSYGTVSKLRRKSDNKIVVWKEINFGPMNEKEKAQLVAEVNILRELRNPFVVRYHDRIVDKPRTRLYIIMEYCAGGDLGRIIKKCKRDRTNLGEELIWKIFAQSVLALKDCHRRTENGESKPVLHRDLKPANILLDAEQNIKMGDFGLAKELSSQSHLAQTNVGTPFYMAPEIINEKQYDEKSDIWSLGCLLYEMASLKPPFEAANVVSLGLKINTGKFARIPNKYSDALFNSIRRMLYVDPRRRPTVEELECLPSLQPAMSRARGLLQEYKQQQMMANKWRDIKTKEESILAREAELEKKKKSLAVEERRLQEWQTRLVTTEKHLQQQQQQQQKQQQQPLTERRRISLNRNTQSMCVEDEEENPAPEDQGDCSGGVGENSRLHSIVLPTQPPAPPSSSSSSSADTSSAVAAGTSASASSRQQQKHPQTTHGNHHHRGPGFAVYCDNPPVPPSTNHSTANDNNKATTSNATAAAVEASNDRVQRLIAKLSVRRGERTSVATTTGSTAATSTIGGGGECFVKNGVVTGAEYAKENINMVTDKLPSGKPASASAVRVLQPVPTSNAPPPPYSRQMPSNAAPSTAAASALQQKGPSPFVAKDIYQQQQKQQQQQQQPSARYTAAAAVGTRRAALHDVSAQYPHDNNAHILNNHLHHHSNNKQQEQNAAVEHRSNNFSPWKRQRTSELVAAPQSTTFANHATNVNTTTAGAGPTYTTSIPAAAGDPASVAPAGPISVQVDLKTLLRGRR